ncbi:D-alanyl-D-alanine carboxypeptidase [Oerskovia sp. M15]
MMLAAGEGDPGGQRPSRARGPRRAGRGKLKLTGHDRAARRRRPVLQRAHGQPGRVPGQRDRRVHRACHGARGRRGPAQRRGVRQAEPRPSLAAAQVFAQRLADEGITVTGTPVRGRPPPTRPSWARWSRHPGEIVGYFLQHSDNTITEVVGRLVALDAGLPATFDGATQAVLAGVERLGVDVEGGPRGRLGAGDGSAVSAKQLGAVLQLLTDPAQPGLRAGAVGLPIAGLSGTLDDRFLVPGPGVARPRRGACRTSPRSPGRSSRARTGSSSSSCSPTRSRTAARSVPAC